MALKKSGIRLLVLDVDGVLTDGGMYFAEGGDEYKKFNAKDGYCIKQLCAQGFQVAFLSSGKNKKLIGNRAKMLGVQWVYVGTEEKLGVLDGWRKKMNITWNSIAYIADDMNDYLVMQKVGLPACPADAVDKIKKVSKVVLSRRGGEACVREFVEKFIADIK